LRNGF